jgi:dUTP pyrophosphatase
MLKGRTDMAKAIDEHLQGLLDRLDDILESHDAAVFLPSFYRAGPPRIFIGRDNIRLLAKQRVGIHYEEPPIDLAARGYRDHGWGRFLMVYEFEPGKEFEFEMEGLEMEREFSQEELVEAVREFRNKLGIVDLVPLLEMQRLAGLKPRGVPLRIKKLDPDITPPAYAHDGDAGLDLCSAEDVDLEPGERAMVSTGFAMALPEGYAAFVQPRSGLAARHGISIVNTPGLIDCHYRGEVKIILINLGRETFEIKRGDRIAQMVIQKVESVRVEVVDELDDTARGEGGFGSTGK